MSINRSVMTLVKLHNLPVVSYRPRVQTHTQTHTFLTSTLPTLELLSLEQRRLYLYGFFPPQQTNKSTFWVASSSRSLVCSCCMQLSSSCCPGRRVSEALLPFGSTSKLSGLRSFQEPMSRFLGREGLRTKSKLKADPKESEREARDLPSVGVVLILVSKSVARQDPQHGHSGQVTYACECREPSVH